MTIYFIEMEGSEAIKIGFTGNNDAARRMAELQTGQPNKLILLGTIPGDQEGERQLHEQFAEFRKNGEWFVGPTSFRWFLRLLSEYKLPWYFARAYEMLDEWREEILTEVSNARPSQDWKDRQIRRQHARIKKMRERIIELQEAASEKQDDPLVSRYLECWSLLGSTTSLSRQ